MSTAPDDKKSRERQGQKGKVPPRKSPHLAVQLIMWGLMLSLLLALFTLKRGPWSEQKLELGTVEFLNLLDKGRILEAYYKDTRIAGVLVDSKAPKSRPRAFVVDVPPSFLDAEMIERIGKGLRNPASWHYRRDNELLGVFLLHGLPWLLVILAAYFFILRPMRQSGGASGAVAFARSRARRIGKEHTGITFADVAGVDEAKEEVSQLVACLKQPERFKRLGARVPHGIILTGYPGTGKTLLAQAIAGEANVPFFSICGSDFVEMFVGVGAARVRDLFRQARESSPCIVFLDEIDAVGRRRGTGLGGGHDEREQTLNAILVEMDGFERDEGVIVIASTNRPDVLDPALLRPGRFDREIVLDLPDLNGREEILKVHSREVKLAESVDLGLIARSTPTFSGAELAALINEAAIMAAMRGKELIGVEELEEARDKVKFGTQKRSRTVSEEDRLITAYHEAGHAVVQYVCPETEPLHKVTIIPRGRSLGMTMSLPEKDRFHVRKAELMAKITVCLAGRAAENMFCGDMTAGAENDLETATKIARLMICRWGMSESVGLVSCRENDQFVFLGREVARNEELSEETLRQIDEETKKTINQCYSSAEDILRRHADGLHRVVEALLEKETLDADQISPLLGETPGAEEVDADACGAGQAEERV